MKTMLGMDYDDRCVVGWIASEKLDGIRCIWDGERLFTRNFRPINAPAWFIEKLPKEPLDGELYLGIDTLGEMAGIVRRKQPRDKDWQRVKYCVFDMPAEKLGFTKRMEKLASLGVENIVPFKTITSENHLDEMFQSIISKGGEGMMLREPHAEYRDGRTDTLLKLKNKY